MAKDEQEIALIARACEITSRAFEEIVPLIRPGVTERELAISMERAMTDLGADGLAFDTIVASGAILGETGVGIVPAYKPLHPQRPAQTLRDGTRQGEVKATGLLPARRESGGSFCCMQTASGRPFPGASSGVCAHAVATGKASIATNAQRAFIGTDFISVAPRRCGHRPTVLRFRPDAECPSTAAWRSCRCAPN